MNLDSEDEVQHGERPEQELNTPLGQSKKALADKIFEKATSAPEGLGAADPRIVGRLDSLWGELLKDRAQERDLKQRYANSFITIAAWQLVGVFFVVMLTGCGVFSYEGNELSIIIGGTLAEVFGIVGIIAGSLFGKGGKSPLDEHKKLEQEAKSMLGIFDPFRTEK